MSDESKYSEPDEIELDESAIIECESVGADEVMHTPTRPPESHSDGGDELKLASDDWTPPAKPTFDVLGPQVNPQAAEGDETDGYALQPEDADGSVVIDLDESAILEDVGIEDVESDSKGVAQSGDEYQLAEESDQIWSSEQNKSESEARMVQPLGNENSADANGGYQNDDEGYVLKEEESNENPIIELDESAIIEDADDT